MSLRGWSTMFVALQFGWLSNISVHTCILNSHRNLQQSIYFKTTRIHSEFTCRPCQYSNPQHQPLIQRKRQSAKGVRRQQNCKSCGQNLCSDVQLIQHRQMKKTYENFARSSINVVINMVLRVPLTTKYYAYYSKARSEAGREAVGHIAAKNKTLHEAKHNISFQMFSLRIFQNFGFYAQAHGKVGTVLSCPSPFFNCPPPYGPV